MTDFWPVTSVHKACTARALALCLCVCPQVAFADAWRAFQDLCLAPMESAENPISPEMELVQDDDVASVHVLTGNTFELAVTTYKSAGPWEPQSCGVFALSDESWSGLVEAFTDWEADQIDLRRYAYIGAAAELNPATDTDRRWRYGLHSTNVREPKLRVYVMRQAGSIVVEDTDLES